MYLVTITSKDGEQVMRDLVVYNSSDLDSVLIVAKIMGHTVEIALQ